MLQTVKQRKYIQDFIDFVGTFLVIEEASIDEMILVKANLEILLKRIQNFGQVKIGGKRSGDGSIFDDAAVPPIF